MTAHAIHWSSREVVIASDTLIYTARNEPLGFRDKVVPLPTLRAALFSRGADHILVSAAATVALRYDLQTLEQVAEALPDILREVTDRVADEYEIHDPYGVILCEARLIGWSRAEGRFKLWTFDNYTNEYAAELVDVAPIIGGSSGWIVSPPLPADFQPKLTGLLVPRALCELMKAQRRRFSTLDGSPVLGGEIVLTTITEAGVSARVADVFPDHEVHGHAAAAVAARIERGEHHLDLNDELTRTEAGIRVDPGAPPAPSESYQSRQQQRRAEKLARRAARHRRAA